MYYYLSLYMKYKRNKFFSSIQYIAKIFLGKKYIAEC